MDEKVPLRISIEQFQEYGRILERPHDDSVKAVATTTKTQSQGDKRQIAECWYVRYGKQDVHDILENVLAQYHRHDQR